MSAGRSRRRDPRPPAAASCAQRLARFDQLAGTAGAAECRPTVALEARPLPTYKRLWRDYSLSIFVLALFLASFVLHAIFGWWQYAADQASHNQDATLWGFDGYIVYFMEWTMQNWQSEFLEVFTLIVATTYLIHKGSPESKDSDEEMKSMLQRIEKRIDALDGEQRKPAKKAS
jgi:succinate dehydrogenase hydrophobic anchor subunit